MPTMTPTAVSDARPVRRIAGVQSQFESTGFAQVMLVLRDDVATGLEVEASVASVGGAAASLRATTAVGAGRPVAGSLSQYFVRPATSQDAMLSSLGSTAALAVSSEPDPLIHVFEHLGVVVGTVTPEGLEALSSDARVSDVHGVPPVSLIRPTATAATKRADGVSWGVRALGVPELWSAGLTGKGILVGHLDTGVDASHPALKSAVAHYAEFDALGRLVPGAVPRDSDKHGTHTAGTIAARSVGKTRFGVAPGAKLASAMVIEGGNVVARILGGMNWLVARDVQILSLSLGLRTYTPAFLALTRILRAKGILPVMAVGNEGAGTSRSPGNYVEALSVGASDEQGGVTWFSGSQTLKRALDPLVPDVVAPGDLVLSCVPGKRYELMSGSSMATPHIAGLAAILMEALTRHGGRDADTMSKASMVDAVERAIFDSARLTSQMTQERANRGLPSGPLAFQILTGQPLTATKPRPTRTGGTPRRKP